MGTAAHARRVALQTKLRDKNQIANKQTLTTKM